MILFLLLLLSSLESGQADYKCSNTNLEVRCGIFNITKTMRHYKIQQWPTEQRSMKANFIECDNVCDFCNVINYIEASCNEDNNRQCETQVDDFLINFCTSPTVTSPLTQAVVSSGCTSSKAATEAITVREITTEQSSSCACDSNQTAKASTEAPEALILGVLMGILLVILALVITGWVWTCWTVSKRRNKTQPCIKCQDCQEKRSYPNPTYGMTTETQPVLGAATQCHSQEEGNEQTHNALNGGDNQDIQGTGEEESREKHVYHVLEKPGGDDYEDPDKDLEENTAMEYEIPMPLKETYDSNVQI